MKRDFIFKLRLRKSMKLPQLRKIVINVGVKEAVLNKKEIIPIATQLELLGGNQCKISKSKEAIASFKLKKSTAIGCYITLSKLNMLEFLLKFKSLVLSNKKDFTGISKSNLDGKGNFGLGLTEGSNFEELSNQYEKFDNFNGMDIIFVTSADRDMYGEILLKKLGIPFVK